MGSNFVWILFKSQFKHINITQLECNKTFLLLFENVCYTCIFYQDIQLCFQMGISQLRQYYIFHREVQPMRKELFDHIPSMSDFDLPIHNLQKDINNNEMKFIGSFQEIQQYSNQFPDYHNNIQEQYLEISQPSIDRNLAEGLPQQAPKTPSKKKKNGCVCKKTSCLKLYCECFSSGKLCTEECSCFKCCNLEDKIEVIESARFLRKSKSHGANDKGCKCKKSNCHKKYCQCYNSGVQCTSSCNCCDCHNMGTKAKIDTPKDNESQNSLNI